MRFELIRMKWHGEWVLSLFDSYHKFIIHQFKLDIRSELCVYVNHFINRSVFHRREKKTKVPTSANNVLDRSMIIAEK